MAEHKYIKKVSKDGKWKYYYADSSPSKRESGGHRIGEPKRSGKNTRGISRILGMIDEARSRRISEKANKRVRRMNTKKRIERELKSGR